jgi:hypothetical protein
VPPRSTAGQQILDLLIGVRIPGGQPNIFHAAPHPSLTGFALDAFLVRIDAELFSNPTGPPTPYPRRKSGGSRHQPRSELN